MDSKSKSDKENIANNGDHEDHGNNNSEDDQNGDIGYHINDGNNDDTDNGNGHNDGQNDAGPSRSAFEVVYRLRRMMVAMRLKKLTQVQVVLEVVAAPNPMVANEVV